MCAFQCNSCFHKQVCTDDPNTRALNEDCALYAKESPAASPALLDELDEILATGCGILGKIGRLKEIARQLRAGS